MTTKDDVETLREQLQISETKIGELEQKIRELEEKLQDGKRGHADEKRRLEQELEKQKKEVTRLQNIIKEKVALEKTFNTQIRSLKKELQDERNKELEKMDARLNALEIDSQKKKQAMTQLRGEVAFFQNKALDSEGKLKIYMQKTERLEKSRNLLYLGQLCANVMTATYKEVLPSYFTSDSRQPHLRDIEKNIDKLFGDERDKVEAKRRWKTFQRKKNIDEELVDFMEQIIAERNVEAHPSPLNKRELRDMASTLTPLQGKKFEKVIEVSEAMGLFLLFSFE